MKLYNEIPRISLFIGLCFLTITFSFVSCQDEDSIFVASSRLNVISPQLVSTMNTRTETGDGQYVTTYTISDDDTNPLYLHVFEKELTGFSGGDSLITKGKEIKKEDLEDDPDGFSLKAYAEEAWTDPKTGNENPAGEYIEWDWPTMENGKWSMSEEWPWLNEVPITFWSWYPWNAAEPVVDFANGTDKASYFLYIDGTKPTKDILFAYNRETRRVDPSGNITGAQSSNPAYNRSDNEMDICFYHALSAIKFDVSGLTGSNLTNVNLQNIRANADCAITISGGVPQFEWTPKTTLKNYSQEFTEDDFKSDGTMVTGSDKVFFLIPQTLHDDAAIEITLKNATDASDVVKLSKSIAKFSETDTENVIWEPGKIYTYKFTSNPFAYNWEYSFAFRDPSTVSPRTKVETTGAYNYEITKSFDITSLKLRQDNPSINGFYGYHISSYQVAGQSPRTVEGQSFSEPLAGMTNVEIVGERLSLKIAKRTVEAKGSNQFWNDPEDMIVHPEWHPAGWESQTSGNPIDLSMMDYRKDNITQSRGAFAMSTANCYVIRHAGYYKLPLVYGNAMLNGTANTSAYAPYPVDTDDTDLSLGVFKNHLDQNITSPFIENHNGCDAASCEVVYQANGQVIQDLHIEGSQRNQYDASNVRYLAFYVDPDEICQNNSLIAIMDADGNIIWSWQIWTTNDPALMENPIEVTSRANMKYYFMSIPSIGRVSDNVYSKRPDITITLEQDAPSTQPPLTITVKQPDIVDKVDYVVYQFGRKDPIRGTSNDINILPAPVSLGTLIQNPNTFYTFSYSYSPSRKINNECPNTPKFINLWSGKHLEVTGAPIEHDATMIKTIYDPSPIGYKVPASGAFSGFTTTGKQAFRNALETWNCEATNVDELGYANFYTSLGPGYTVNFGAPTIYFPDDGMRAGFTGQIYPSNGMFYSCNFQRIKPGEGPEQYTESYMFGVTSNSIGVSTASPCNGHNIRSVTDPGFTLWWTGSGAPNGN